MSETTIKNSHRAEPLVKMLNQIAANTPRKESPDATAETIAAHVKKFWARSMKQDIKAYVENGGEGLSGMALVAVRKL